MSYLLPQSVRHNFHVKKGEQGWDMVCLSCKQTFHLDKPKGPADVEILVQHTAIHNGVSIGETRPKRESRRPNSVPPSATTSLSPEPSRESSRVDNAYMVVFTPGTEPVSTFIRLQHALVSPTVDRHGKDGYVVLLHAANSRHAIIVADRLVKDYKRRGGSGMYRAVTLRPPKIPTPSKPPVE